MFNNFFTIAFRNLKKHRFYSFINITGLSTGLACCLLITFYVADEISYDKYHEKNERIYRIINYIKFGGSENSYTVSPAPLAPAAINEIPEIETGTRFRNWGSFLVRRQDKEDNYKEYRVTWSDPQIFEVFTIPLIQGKPESALTEPGTLVISRSLAKKYFGQEDPMDQVLILNNDMQFKITGVFQDIPDNSHFHFDILLSMESLDESRNQMWLSENFQTYLVLRPGSDPAVVEKKLNDLNIKYASPQVIQYLGLSMNEFEESGSKVELSLQPLEKIHLHSDMSGEFEPNGDIKYVFIFSAVSFFILILALVNFINLSTARSSERAREVGIRKVLGSYRIYLVRQFLSESILHSLISIMIAILLAFLALPFFNSLSGKNLSIPFGHPLFWMIIISGTFIIGILAGIYPALFLSSFKPVSIFQGKYTRGSGGNTIRNILVVFQFTTSIALIIATMAVYNQLNFIQHKKLGFNKDQVIFLNDTFVLGQQIESFKNEMLRQKSILSATISSYLPVSNSERNLTTLWKKGNKTPENSVLMQYWQVDADYIETLAMHMVQGRAFLKDSPADSDAIILNESAVRLLGFDDPIGQELETFRSTRNNSISNKPSPPYRIIGVVENFHFESLRENIGPLCMTLGNRNGKISFRYEASKTADVLEVLRKKWREMAPGQPFQYGFLDEEFGNMYHAEKRTEQIFFSFAVIAIIIACLGLFALAAFIAEQRTKEIGVRKVMGATRSNIILMLTKDFGKLILIAFILSVPLAWYGISQWLNGFAYKDVPGIMLYGAAGLTALLIAWLTVGYQSFKAASANPATSLRSE